MDFPDFENNDIQINDEDTNQNHYGNIYQAPIYQQSTEYGIQGGMNSMDWASPIDPEEQKRLDARKAEEDERRNKLNDRIRKELEGKQENRRDAAEWLQRWDELRQGNIAKKREFNKANEEEYLKNRELAKEGKTNPWDRVIENIQLKESDHKGQKDITRMKAVILQRKADFINMKMK